MMTHSIRLFSIVLVFLLFSSTGCKKENRKNQTSNSSINVQSDGIYWTETRGVGTFNTADSIVSILGQDGLETFSIRFKKPILNGVLNAYNASALFSPFRGSAAIADHYHLDETKDNRFRIYVMDNLKKRIAGEFDLYLLRDERYGVPVVRHYKGKFDIILEDISL